MSVLAPWQQRPLQTALAALMAGRLGHALLLGGAARLGKRAVADALAARLLCSTPGADGLACGHCRGCRLLAAGTHPDFLGIGLEVNEKTDKLRSEVTIDQVRRLGRQFALTPQLGGAQVAVLDPADALNTSACNALLKTLEEPMPGRYLLMVSAHPARLPATIRSRCQRLEFRIPGRDEARQWLLAAGHAATQVDAALEAAHGHPGLAADWLADGSLELRRSVRADLAALAAGKAGALDVAARWLADERVELRLSFAADTARDLCGRLAGAVPMGEAAALTARADFTKLSAWFDAANRTRDLLRTTVRADLTLAGLLRDWRLAFAGT
ncbi:DNA polymerase III subunit delta' [Rehaibacterium terrae]|uniref:DNA-directed DNA polymerase n=1 Tax=Rehaibacterium terrae TaxID=1341696 RepID=A0A7W7XZC9_9GAMM|nr:DNA polymerase-3 subunit delta' [Rehaibacterium terrae]